ncbi:MAG: glycosyltransferase [Subdoligranulum sp.]|nr:glycosyltransferase [Subdoligranulum sp.]
MRYDVILVTCNSEKWLWPCVAALKRVHYPLGELRLIFCDNASADGTRETLRRLRAEEAQQGGDAFGSFEIVENETDISPGAACNRGAARGDAPMLLFLNVDAEADADLFARLDAAQERHPDAGGFECRRTPYETGRHIDPVTMETAAIGGAALAVPRAVFTEAGGFDEHLDAYVPMDRRHADLSWRIRAAGHRLYYTPFARVACDAGESGGPALDEYAGGLYGDLLLRCKFGGLRTVWDGHKKYLDALRRPQHFDGVRRVLVKNYLRHFAKLWPFLFWRFSHRAGYSARTACFAGGLSSERGTCALLPAADGPLVSVIVRTCGRPEILRRTLQSLRWQTWRNFEIVVTEDGPDTARVLLETEFADLPIRYLNDGVRHGRAANGNRGLAAAKGTLCNFLDDDDFFYPDHLELLVGFWCAHPEADLVLGSAMALFCLPDGTATQLEPMIFDRIDRFSMCQNCRIPIQTVLFRHSLFERYGGLLETLDAHEDWGMWLKYLEHGRRVTPHAPDIRRATSIFVQPAGQEAADARMDAYRKSDDAFFADSSLQFTVTLADLRRYYDDMIADLRCLEARGELHDYLEREAKRGG